MGSAFERANTPSPVLLLFCLLSWSGRGATFLPSGWSGSLLPELLGETLPGGWTPISLLLKRSLKVGLRFFISDRMALESSLRILVSSLSLLPQILAFLFYERPFRHCHQDHLALEFF